MTEIDLTPVTRLEYDIDAILNDHAVAEPITRIELILADIVAGNTTTVEPVTRIETYLAIISGADYPVPEPVTRIETFLAIIAGEDYEEPEAVTRLEGLLAEWVEKGSGIWKTVSGSLIHITDAIASPMRKCEVTLEPIQDLHGQDAPYPAGGGVNKFGGVYNVRFTFLTPIPSGTTITVSTANGSGNTRVNFGNDSDLRFYNGGINTLNSGLNRKYRVVTLAQEAKSVYFDVFDAGDYQIEIGGTPTTYKPYSNICPITGWTGVNIYHSGEDTSNPTVYTVSWQDETGTVYGGTVDLVSGVLTVDRKLAVLTHTMAWEKGATNTATSVFFLSDAVVSDKSPASWDSVETIANWAIKSTEKSTEAAHMVSGRYYWTTADGNWRVGYGTPDTTVDEFKAFLQTNPLQVVCPITTPINYQLTPQEISTLKGVNNVWSNSNGETTIIYKAQAE